MTDISMGAAFLVTATYPWGLFGDEAAQPAEGIPCPGPDAGVV
jgi:hypothetical protein